MFTEKDWQDYFQLKDLSFFQVAQLQQGPLFQLDVEGGEAAWTLWQSLRAEVERTGYWPLLLGTDSFEGFEGNGMNAAAELEAASAIHAQNWLEKQALRAEGEDWDDDEEDDEEDAFVPEGPFEHPEGARRFVILHDILTGVTHPRCYVLLVPTPHVYEIPALLELGGWNECPDPAVQVAVLKMWSEQYGAEWVCLNHDTFEFIVKKPPQTEEEALTLAQAQYAYCPDIVDQGVGTVARLQETLRNNPTWFFWWD